ncbi:MAG: hypothetical protein PVH31_05895 [Ectothiorhodospiraceae bacterium]
MPEVTDNAALMELLEPDGTGIISASCCSAEGALAEEQLLERVEEARRRTGQQFHVTVESITNAQRGLMFIGPKLDSRQKALVGQLLQLFQDKGLALFPVLIIRGHVAAHSEIPSVEIIEAKLRETPETNTDASPQHQDGDRLTDQLAAANTGGCCSPEQSIQSEPESYPQPSRLGRN